MDKEIKKLENCLKAMKKCLKIPKVESCICFSDAFKVLKAEANELYNKIDLLPDIQHQEKVKSLKKEIEEIQEIISGGNKECLGCSPCIASVVFKAYPTKLDNLYLDDKL